MTLPLGWRFPHATSDSFYLSLEYLMKIASRLAIAGVVLAAGGLLASCAATAGTETMPGMSHSSSTPAASHNAQDVMLAQMMLVHHEGAIAMANSKTM